MKNKFNGDRIVLKKLDECVIANTHDTDDPEFKLQIDFSRLESSNSNCDVIKDIISIRHIACTKVLLHPVIQSYIDIRWRKMKRFVYANFWLYVLFLCSYSWFLRNIFYRQLHETPALSPFYTKSTIEESDIGSRHGLNNPDELRKIPDDTTNFDQLHTFSFADYKIAIFKEMNSSLTG